MFSVSYKKITIFTIRTKEMGVFLEKKGATEQIWFKVKG